MHKTVAAALLAAATTFASPTHAIQPRGTIQNHLGQPCSYTQQSIPKTNYFHSMASPFASLRFDNPGCMRAEGFELEVNKMMINNIITKNYSHADAAFMTRPGELRKTSKLQIKGQCIQSKTYPIIGVAVEYITSNGAITTVNHTATILGCID